MDKLVYHAGSGYKEEWLKEKDLVVGRIYLIKDGRLMLYLGKSTIGMYIFYALASAYLIDLGNRKGITFGNYDAQIKGLTNIVTESLNKPGIANGLLEYKGLPKIYGEFPFVNFEKRYAKWYIVSFTRMFSDKVPGNLPNLVSISHKKVEDGFVKSKDLVPGELYYSGQCWRATYVYLGRNSDNEYIWYFVSSEVTLLKSNATDLLRHAGKTKQNKKVKPLAMAVHDKNAYVCKDTLDLINSKFKVNMSGITKQLLDQVY